MKQSQKIRNLDQKINNWKSHIEVYLLSSDFLAESLKANKNWQKISFILQCSFTQKPHLFDNLNSLNIVQNILPQRSQKPTRFTNFLTNMFLFDVRKKHLHFTKELHSRSIGKVNVCIFLYISAKECLFQRRRKLYLVGGWIISLRRLVIWTS